MSRTSSVAAALLALAAYGSAASATPTTDEAEPVPAPMQASFRGDACRVLPGAGFEAANAGTVDDWQGAATAPLGHTETLVFGSVLQEAATEAVVAPIGDQAAQDIANRALPVDPEANQRRRMFLLGLAILLNINTKQ